MTLFTQVLLSLCQTKKKVASLSVWWRSPCHCLAPALLILCLRTCKSSPPDRERNVCMFSFPSPPQLSGGAADLSRNVSAYSSLAKYFNCVGVFFGTALIWPRFTRPNVEKSWADI